MRGEIFAVNDDVKFLCLRRNVLAAGHQVGFACSVFGWCASNYSH